MIGEKALGEKLAKRLDEYAVAWDNSALAQPDNVAPADWPKVAERARIIANVLKVIALVIRDVTQ